MIYIKRKPVLEPRLIAFARWTDFKTGQLPEGFEEFKTHTVNPEFLLLYSSPEFADLIQRTTISAASIQATRELVENALANNPNVTRTDVLGNIRYVYHFSALKRKDIKVYDCESLLFTGSYANPVTAVESLKLGLEYHLLQLKDQK